MLVFLVVAGRANAVNLTDGLDGLAAGTVTIAMLAYTAMMVVAFLSPGRRSRPEGAASRLDLAIFGAALVGGCIGFLWYNAFPADVFMGDTGSLGLGGALAAHGGLHQDRGPAAAASAASSCVEALSVLDPGRLVPGAPAGASS